MDWHFPIAMLVITAMLALALLHNPAQPLVQERAIALAEPEETQQHIVPARELMRPRP